MFSCPVCHPFITQGVNRWSSNILRVIQTGRVYTHEASQIHPSEGRVPHSQLLDGNSKSATPWQSQQSVLFPTQINTSLDVSLWSVKPSQNPLFKASNLSKIRFLTHLAGSSEDADAARAARLSGRRIIIQSVHSRAFTWQLNVLFNQALPAPKCTRPAILAQLGVDEIRQSPACGSITFACLTSSI